VFTDMENAMKEIRAIIERITRLNEHYQWLHLAVDAFHADIRAGQSLLARRLPERWDPYLREQWWPVATLNQMLIVERSGAEVYEPGEIVSLMGFVGQPFRYKRTLRNVLLIADNTPPSPFIMAIQTLLANRIAVTLVLSGSAANYPTAHLPPEVEVVVADDHLNWSNRVMTVGWADQVFATVAGDDEMGRMNAIWRIFSESRAEVPANYLFGVFQPLLPCGAGACAGCMLPLKQGETALVCMEGPAIDLSTVALPAPY
jgi:hypothetical protein